MDKDVDSDRQEEPKPSLTRILLDTNMIQHFLDKEKSPHLTNILGTITGDEVELAVSLIVVYESLKAIVFKPEKFNQVNNFFRDYIIRYPIDERLLLEAARVHEMYGSIAAIKTHLDAISTEDIIIATTAMLYGAYVLTCDVNDYPAPFFKEANRIIVDYKKGRVQKHIVVYVLGPDDKIITRHLSQLEAKKP